MRPANDVAQKYNHHPPPAPSLTNDQVSRLAIHICLPDDGYKRGGFYRSHQGGEDTTWGTDRRRGALITSLALLKVYDLPTCAWLNCWILNRRLMPHVGQHDTMHGISQRAWPMKYSSKGAAGDPTPPPCAGYCTHTHTHTHGRHAVCGC